VPSGITEVEERASLTPEFRPAREKSILSRTGGFGDRRGIDIAKPDGHMVVDIGGGTTDVAVISLSGIVEASR
jgi:rod shape-determining protein MreB